MAQERERDGVIVTGAGSGIGHAVARRLLDEGYRVSGWDVEAGRLDDADHGRLSFRRLDVRDRSAMERAAREAAEASARVIGLVTCAAIYRTTPFLELDEASWDEHFAVNLKGSLLACQAVLPIMRRQRAGRIVMFASTAARAGAVNGAHYAATKGGILGLARSMALDYAREGIRVNVVSPGVTDTPQPRGHRSDAELRAMGERNPLQRIGRPEDMAEAALFLLSDDSSFVTGQDLRVNGGGLLF